MKTQGYERTCILCDRLYLAKVATEIYTRLCDDCRSRGEDRQAKIIRRQCIRAIQLNLPANLTLKQWIKTLDDFRWKCAYCKIHPVEALDHFIPLIDGTKGTTADNCLPICRSCNSSKWGLHPDYIIHGWPSGAQRTIIPNDAQVIKELYEYLKTRSN